MEQNGLNSVHVFATICSILFSINIWFIRSLTMKIDESWNAMRDFRKDIEHLNQKIDSLSDISKKVFLLEKTVAVLQFIANGDKKQSVEDVFKTLET